MFAKEWETYLHFQELQGPLSDEGRLLLLRGALDEATNKDIQRRMEGSERPTYASFMRDLEKVFGEGTGWHARQDWREMRGLGSSHLTRDSLRQIWAEFQLRRDRVENWTTREEWELLLQN